MANWEEKTDSCAGTCVKFGAPDVRRFSRLYNNQNVNICSFACSTEEIHEGNVWTWQADACGNTAEYYQSTHACGFTYRVQTSTLAANRIAILPTLTATDTFTFNNAVATIQGKTIDLNSSNIIRHTGAAAGDVLQYNLVCTRYESRAIRETIITRFGDSTTTIGTGNGQYEFQMPYCFTLTGVYATVATASSCGVPSIQIKQTALDILSTAITIDVSEKTSRTAVVPPVISDTTLDINGVITFDLDAVGTGVTGLVIYLIGYQRF